ncbi:DUF2235 domain-containing protein [Candidatus Sumerlaeota bacterium]|nr:DUF2235 domain-containing protein [Candidatus Sumerlaeota bacterium]
MNKRIVSWALAMAMLTALSFAPQVSHARWYDPQSGQFMSPDPVFDFPDNFGNRYVYAGNNPANNIDPDGRSLFAFDGSGQWEAQAHVTTIDYLDLEIIDPCPTNVRRFHDAYLDRNPHHYRGVGNPEDFIWPSERARQATGYGMASVLREAVRHLEEDRAEGDMMADIVGFSRGGIEAIAFANIIAENYPGETIRFVGLFDPVGSVGGAGRFGGYPITLPEIPGMRSAQAISIDEDRRWFPGTDVNVTDKRRFRGVHGDIGGGFADHDIADFVLQWMTDRAIEADVSIDLRLIMKYGWHPDENGTVNKNKAWYPKVRVGRLIKSPTGDYTITSGCWLFDSPVY